MQVGSSQSSQAPLLTYAPGAEAAERGPDRDNDGDEGGKALSTAATPEKVAQSLSTSGRGQRVNMVA